MDDAKLKFYVDLLDEEISSVEVHNQEECSFTTNTNPYRERFYEETPNGVLIIGRYEFLYEIQPRPEITIPHILAHFSEIEGLPPAAEWHWDDFTRNSLSCGDVWKGQGRKISLETDYKYGIIIVCLESRGVDPYIYRELKPIAIHEGVISPR